MANALYELGRQKFLEGSIAWLTDTIKAQLIDVDTYYTTPLTVTAATNASPIAITSSASHGMSTGDKVAILKVLGNTATNGTWTITVTDSTHFTLNGSTGNGAYTSGGFIVKLSLDQWISDIAAAAKIGTAVTLGTKTSTRGVADAADFTFTAVSGASAQVDALVFYKDTGTPGTSALIAWVDTATGLPVQPNGGDIVVTLDNGANRILML